MKLYDFLHLYLSLAIWLLTNVKISFQISCRDENNQDVDWFIVYKLPTVEKEREGTYLRVGKGYAFMTSAETSGAKWTLSSHSIDSRQSILAKTFQGFRDVASKGSEVAYLFYNDQPPVRVTEKSAAGHLKGYIAFDSESGIWLTHSIPRYGNVDRYRYPPSALKNGQTAMCITFKTRSLTDLCNHLLMCHPNIYLSKISKSMAQGLDQTARTIFTRRPAFRTGGKLTKVTSLQSMGNQQFTAFAKDNQMRVDLYGEIIGPYFQTNLLVESWRLGKGFSPTYKDVKVIDIASINMTVKNRQGSIAFRSKEDHSKWAISTDGTFQWICIGDLNHRESQKKRGGGAVCFHSQPIWKAFRDIIGNNERQMKSAFGWNDYSPLENAWFDEVTEF